MKVNGVVSENAFNFRASGDKKQSHTMPTPRARQRRLINEITPPRLIPARPNLSRGHLRI